MSKADWGYLLLAWFFVFWWFAARLDRLGRQLEYASNRISREMAELLGNEERANELREEGVAGLERAQEGGPARVDWIWRYWCRGTGLVVVHRRCTICLVVAHRRPTLTFAGAGCAPPGEAIGRAL
jgi:hypothetical protein